MILKLKHDFDGKHERVRFFSSEENGLWVLMGMLAMNKDEFRAMRIALDHGGSFTGMKVMWEEDVPKGKNENEGEIRIPR